MYFFIFLERLSKPAWITLEILNIYCILFLMFFALQQNLYRDFKLHYIFLYNAGQNVH